MKRVRILVAHDGFAVGDTPELFGHVARKLVEEGRAETIDEMESEAKKSGPARKRHKAGS